MNKAVNEASQQHESNPHYQLVADILETHRQTPGSLLPIAHDIQQALGYIPAAAIGQMAKALQQTRAQVHGVISFYPHFRTSPPGLHVVQVCRAEACQARGGRQLERHIQQTLGVDYHATTRDGEITLEPVYCLGNCACGPTLQVDDQIVGRVTAAVFDQVLEALTTVVVEIK